MSQTARWVPLGKELKRLRLAAKVTQKKKLTQERLLEKVPVYSDPRHLRKIEAGQKRPVREKLIRLATEGCGLNEVEAVDRLLQLAEFRRLCRQEIGERGLQVGCPTMFKIVPAIETFNPVPDWWRRLPETKRAKMLHFHQDPIANARISPEEGAYLRQVLMKSRFGVYAFDRKGLITAWNRAIERLLGWRAPEVLSQYPPFVLDQNQFARQLVAARKGEICKGFGHARYRKDGSPVDLLTATKEIRKRSGYIYGFIFVTAIVPKRDTRGFKKHALAWEKIWSLLHDARLSLLLRQAPRQFIG